MLRLFFRVFFGTVVEEGFETTQITLLFILHKAYRWSVCEVMVRR